MLDEKDNKTTKNPYEKHTPTEFPPDRAYRKSQANIRLQAMKQEYLLWKPAFMEIKKYIAPLNGIFDTMPTNRAQMIDHKTLLDGYAVQCARDAASGLTQGMTSPSSPWVKFELDMTREMTTDESMWLDAATEVIYMMLKRSNIHTCLHGCHKELVSFGTGCFIIVEDYDDVVRGRQFTMGQYYLGVDSKGRVNSFAREFWIQVGQMVQEFGYDNCSPTVRNNYDYNKRDVWVKINHLIEPNDNRIGQLADYKNMAFRSCYWDNADATDRFLAARGYKRFNVVAPRWEVNSTDQIYGYAPGWYALGNAKELQKAKYDKLTQRDKHGNPPMVQDANVEGNGSYIPGGITKTSANNVPNAGVRPAYQIQYDAAGHQLTRQELQQDIQQDFFIDLFKMLISRPDDKTMTAYEVAELQQEKIMMMGPVLYNIEKGELDCVVELLWDIAVENNLIPVAPESLQGQPIKVVYTSILSQAMRALGVNTINKTIAFVANLNAISPETAMQAADNLDIDFAVQTVNKLEGSPAKVIRDPKVVAQGRAQRAQAQQAAQQSAMMSATAKGMSDMGKVPMNDPTGKSNAGEQLVKKLAGKK
jgi:hypothetical protein